jgi:uncharacterized protein involved in exopolysaccharide biosynthesis
LEEPQQQTDEINLIDYIIVLAKRKKLILRITLGAAILTTIISLIMPLIYRGETRILPPQESGSSLAMQMISQVAGGAASGFAGSALGIRNPNEMYVEMLRSRFIFDRIIDRFKLMELYDKEYRVDTYKELEGNIDIQDDKKSGIITIGVEDKDPKRAAEMANAFVEELRSLTKGLAISEAAQRRLFYEEQLKEVKGSLIKAEEGMQGFQEKTGALQMDEQAKAVIEGIANLRAQIAAKEVEMKVMKTYSTANNPDLQKAEEALKGMKSEMSKLEVKEKGSSHNTLMPTGKMPAVGTEYVRKLRDVKFNETLYGLLLNQYELAKIDEARSATIIQVIDKATPPEKKAKPKRALMVVLATCMGLFFSVFLAFFLEYKEKEAGNPENRKRFETLREYLKFRRKDVV